MNRIIKLALLIGLSGISLNTFAADAPSNLIATWAGDTTLSLDWSDVDDVLWYYIYYGTTTGSGSSYEIEWVDLIEQSDFLLEWLLPETTYYISVTSVDEFGSESDPAEELVVDTLALWETWEIVNFKAEQVTLIDDTTFEIQFSANLELGDSAQRAFIVENVLTGEELVVDISEVLVGDTRSVIVVLWSSLQTNTEYKVTVLDIRDENQNTIESWINAFVNFTTPEQFISELESAWPESIPEPISEPTPVIESDPLPQEAPLWEDASSNNAGTTIDSEVIADNTTQTASENEKLPQTGPEHWILLFMSFLIAGGIYKMSSQKES